MWTAAFWKAAIERAVKSAAQGALVFWSVGDGLLNLWNVDFTDTLGIAGGMGVVSILTSLISGGVTGGQASIVKAETVADAPTP
jgi:small neutral amino acid transporter SnatA (MarC family)